MLKHFLIILFLYSLISSNKLFGQYGVNTNSPETKLDVVGDSGTYAALPAQMKGIMRISNSSVKSTLDFGVGKENYGWIQSRNSTSLTTIYPLVINPNGGNVGINTSSPTDKLTVVGTIGATGVIRSSAAGQIINSVYLEETDLSITSNQNVNSTIETTIASYTYTPKSSSSKIYVEFDAYSWIDGWGNDVARSYLYATPSGGSDVLLQTNAVEFNNGAGSDEGGGRSNTIFPIIGYYTNSSTSNVTISVRVKNVTSNDPIRIYPDLTLIVKEVAR